MNTNRKHGAAKTSIDNYQDIRRERVTAAQQKAILAIVRKYPQGLTRREISVLTGIETGAVGGRCNVMAGITLVEMPKRKCTISNRSVGVVVAKNQISRAPQ